MPGAPKTTSQRLKAKLETASLRLSSAKKAAQKEMGPLSPLEVAALVSPSEVAPSDNIAIARDLKLSEQLKALYEYLILSHAKDWPEWLHTMRDACHKTSNKQVSAASSLGQAAEEERPTETHRDALTTPVLSAPDQVIAATGRAKTGQKNLKRRHKK